MIGIKNQQFGVEIEFTGITRREAAKALADYFQTGPVYVPVMTPGPWRIPKGGSGKS